VVDELFEMTEEKAVDLLESVLLTPNVLINSLKSTLYDGAPPKRVLERFYDMLLALEAN
jgi:hypothetical protein